MDKYETIKAIGDGSFGSVTKARNKFNNEIVAIKRMKAQFASWDEAMKLREVKSLRKLNHHNIVKLKEVIRQQDSLFFVFEFMERNLYERLSKSINTTGPPNENEIRRMAYDSLTGIAACHKNGYFHRDLKPENLLINNEEVVKIADFGLAKEIRSRPPHTEYVSTRWYRAPELLLCAPNYNSPIDIFAMGCILIEMYLLRPLAPGNSEADQLMKLCLVLGTPPMEWTEGYQLAATRRIDFPRCPVTPFESIVPNACPDGIDLILKMLQWDPQKRPTASQCLQHPFFTSEVRAAHQQKVAAYIQNESETNTHKIGKPPVSNGSAGFNVMRTSTNKLLGTKQMSSGALTPLANNASSGAIVNDYGSSRGPSGIDQKGSSLLPREGAPSNQSNLNLRNNIGGSLHQNTTSILSSTNNTPLGGSTISTKPWEQQAASVTASPATGTPATQLGDSYGASYLRSSNPQFSNMPKNQNNNRAGVGGALYSSGQTGGNNSSLSSNGPTNQKIIIAPKLQGSLKGGLGQSSGMGSSSILNLPVLGQENQLLPTNRNLKATESTRQLYRNEESKISSSGAQQQPGGGNHLQYYSRQNAQGAGTSITEKVLSPSQKKDGKGVSQTSRNLSVLNMKKSARFLTPLGGGIDSNVSGQAVLSNLAANGGANKGPPSMIEKYPATQKADASPLVIPRPRNESKNSQLFDSYMNRQQNQSHRKTSLDLPSPLHGGHSNSSAKAADSLALPSLAAPSARNTNAQASNFQSQQRRADPMRASLSDSDFDF